MQRALESLGCIARPGKGSHCPMTRVITDPDGVSRRVSAPIVLGRKEMDRFTLRSILRRLEISEQEFEAVV